MIDPCTEYCHRVLNGEIVSGKLAIASCERHLADLKDGEKRGLFWRPEFMQRPFEFFPSCLTITSGAMVGQPFHIISWMTFVLGQFYGWRRADGTRRYRQVFLENGRGQIKGPTMAAVAIYELFFCGIKRAEGYCIGENMVTSSALFRDAVAFCRATMPNCEEGDSLESRGIVKVRGSGELSWQLEHPSTGSKFQALAVGDAISGPRPTYLAVDEAHEFKSEKPIEQWASALAKASGSPSMWIATNTPAVNQVVGTDYSEYFQRVAKRQVQDDAALAYIARTDPEDDPLNDPSCWPKSLPALGITYPAENVEIEVNRAKQMASKRLSVLRLFFGRPVGQDEFWINEEAWEGAQGAMDEEQVRGWPCYLGLDLSRRHDLTALSLVFKDPTGRLYGRVRYWKPKEGLHLSEVEDKAPYTKWAEEGILETTPGRSIGYDFIVQAVQHTCAKYDVKMMAFDPAFMTDWLKEADNLGFECYEFHPDKPAGRGLKLMKHSQGAMGMHSTKSLWLPRSFQAMCDAILESRITIERNPISTYCASNVVVDSDAQGNQFLNKRRSRGHIDGIVALVMAVGAACYEQPSAPAFKSIWSML